MKLNNKFPSATVHFTPYSGIWVRSFILILAISVNGCKKMATVPPPITSISGDNVYQTDATAISVLTGLYSIMASTSNSGGSNGTGSVSFLCGLSADELTLFSGVSGTLASTAYYKNALVGNTTTSTGGEIWNKSYVFIYTCNDAISRISNSTALTPAVKQQLLGEAKFMRAFFYFYLTNLYGNVPLAISNDYTINSTLPRSSSTQVYQQIIADLKDAQNLLSVNYLDASLLKVTTEKVRPTKWAATALLARVYLYTNDPVDAETQASTIINNAAYSLATLNSVFKLNSSEAIWQLQPVVAGHNTEDGWTFILPSGGPNSSTNPVYLTSNILGAFEAADQRKVIGNWINSVTVTGTTYYYPFKYKSATLNASVSEYQMVLRLAEQYLIRAEASAQGGSRGISGAIADLNVIRSRAGLGATTATDKASLLTAIAHERQTELFTEWGDRWFDTKRTGTVDAVMNVAAIGKGITWNSYQQLYPIPLADIQKDPNLTQNTGY